MKSKRPLDAGSSSCWRSAARPRKIEIRQGQRDHAKRQIDDKNGVPAKGGGQVATNGWAKGGSQQDRHANDRRCYAALGRGKGAVDQREDDGIETATTHPLQNAEEDQQRCRRGNGAQSRNQRKQAQRQHKHQFSTDFIAQVARDGDDGSLGQEVARRNPGDGGEIGFKSQLHLWQSHAYNSIV